MVEHYAAMKNKGKGLYDEYLIVSKIQYCLKKQDQTTYILFV